MRSEKDFIAVLARYDLGDFRAARPIERGYVNALWVVETTKGHFVLKRRHPDLRDVRRIAGQHALVRHLAEVGFPAPPLVAATSGATFVHVEHEVYEIQEYIAGRLCDSMSPAHVAASARMLGRYHLAVSGFDHPALYREGERYGPEALARIWEGLRKDWSGKLTLPVERLSAALDRHVRDIRALDLGAVDLPELVIHGDYYAENLIWQSDSIVGVVDYDQAHWCARVFEVAEALLYFAREANRRFRYIVYPGVLDLDAVERFLAAYTEIAGLTKAEARALPHLVRIIWMCASLAPPLRPRLRLEDATQALPEVLALADWASTHAAEIAQIGLEFERGGKRPMPLSG